MFKRLSLQYACKPAVRGVSLRQYGGNGSLARNQPFVHLRSYSVHSVPKNFVPHAGGFHAVNKLRQ